MSFAHQLILSLLAGAGIHLGFAPYSLELPGFTGLLLFCALVCTTHRPDRIFSLSLAFGFGLFGAGINWLYVSIHEHGQIPSLLAGLGTALFALFLAFVFALPWLAFNKMARSQNLKFLCFPAFWLFSEWLRSWLLTGFPWLYLGYGQLHTPLAGWVPVLGVFGSGALLALSSALIVYVLGEMERRKTIAVALVLTLIWGGGSALRQAEWTQSMGVELPVSLVQPNIPQEKKWQARYNREIANILESESQLHMRPGLLIWPEAALPYTGNRALPYLEVLNKRTTLSNTALVTGVLSYDHERGSYLNTLIGLGEAYGAYYKQRLVPFGEYVPLEQQLRGLIHFFDLPMSMITAGPAEQQPLQFEYQNQSFGLAPAICYEIAYADIVRKLARDSQILVTLSNDAWFGASIGPWQHMQIAQSRALENQKPLIRSTNNGVSALVNHNGEIIKQLPQFVQANMQGILKPRNGQTPFNHWGNWPVLILTTLVLFSSLLRSNSSLTS